MTRLLNFAPGGRFHHVRFRAALELLYSAAIRISELVGLDVDQIDLREGWIRVIGKGSKERLVPVGPRAKEALLTYRETRERRFDRPDSPLFLNSRGGRITCGGFAHQLAKAALTCVYFRSLWAILPSSPPSAIPMFRRTCARAHPRY
jgi:integrase/recombinase XerC